MISVSSNYKTNATKPVRNINAKISIGSVDYGIEDIVSLDISRSTSDGGISVGGTSAARLTATIRADLLPTMDAYKVTVFIGFTKLTQIGIFYITDLSQEKGYVNIEAYDRFYFLDKPCSFNGSADDTVDALSFPATHQDLLSYIGKINDFTISAKSNDFAKIKTKPVYNSEAANPTNKYYTYREIIGFIAACNGCNAQFDANDKLIFTRPSNSVETIEEGACESLSVAQDSGFTVKGIRFTIGTDTAFYIDANGTAYDETLPGVLEAVNPLATVEIMEYVWNKLGGYHYYAADISRRGRGWLLPDDVATVNSNGTTKKVTVTAISYSLSKDSGFSEQITSTAESTEQSSNRYSAAADHTSNAGAGKYNSTTIINDPVIISERTKEYLKYDYSIIGYSVDDKITYGLDGGDTDIIVQGFKATYNDSLGAICGDFTVFNGIYGSDKIYAQSFVKFRFYLDITRVIQYSEYTEYWINLMSEYTTVDGDTVKKIETSVRARHGNFSKALKWKEIYPPSTEFPCGRARVILGINFHNNVSVNPEEYTWSPSQTVDVSFSSVDEYNSAVQLTRSPLEKKDVTQTVSKVIEANGTADFPELGDTEVLYIDSSDNSAYKWSSKISAYYCVGRDYFSIKQIQSVAEPNSSEAEILEAQLLQDMRSPAEWTLHSSFVPPKGYMCITDFESGQHGIKIGDGNTPWSELLYVNLYDIDLSEYLKTGDISDWAKADSKPTYTAEEIGAAEKNHTHNMSDITDMPEWAKTENKPVYTAEEVGAATAADITAAVNAVEIGGRNLLYDSTGNLKNGWSGNTVITVDGGISGNSLAISRTGYSGNARYFGVSKRHFLTEFNVGTSYTLSAWIKVRSDVELDASGYVMARFRSADGKKLYALSLTVGVDTVKDKWLYYEKTWTINDSDIAKLECVALALNKNGMIEACNIKLEKGTKATDWSPAPEEDTERIASLEARVAALEAAAVSGGEV